MVDWNLISGLDDNVWSIVNNTRTNNLTLVMKILTHAADVWFLVSLVIFTIVVLIIKRKIKLAAWFGFSTLLGASILNKILKVFYARPRPFINLEVDNLIHANGFSFPSGHAMCSIIVYLSLAYILTKYVHSKIFAKIICGSAVAFSIIICVTRVYLAVHYPSDVIAGFSLGLAWVMVSIIFYRKFVERKKI